VRSKPRIGLVPILFVLVGVVLTGAAGLVSRWVDASPLDSLPDGFRATRDISYGPWRRNRLDLVHPIRPARPAPALLLIHPGGWFQGDKSAYHGLMARAAGLGYVTAALNHRLSGEARYPAPLDDCREALRWLIRNAEAFGIDPARIGVMGHSSGAHLALRLALDGDAGRVRAAVGISGVYDFLLETRGAFPNDENDPAVVRFLGARPSEIPEVAQEASPISHLDAGDPPMLLLHGEADRRVDVEQTRRFRDRLRELKRDDEVILVPGGGHGRGVLPDDPGLRRRIEAFLRRELRPGE
jgi:acetyl esterase/lipase